MKPKFEISNKPITVYETWLKEEHAGIDKAVEGITQLMKLQNADFNTGATACLKVAANVGLALNYSEEEFLDLCRFVFRWVKL